MLADILDRDTIADFVTVTAFAKGRAYQGQGRVTGLRISGDFLAIGANVLGSERLPYRVDIALVLKGGQLADIEGTCTCPMEYNCKHVAAVLLDALARPTAAKAGGPTVLTPAPPLPYEINAWLEKLGKSSRGDDYPPGVNQRLVYVLHPKARGAEMPRLGVSLRSIRLLKTGEFSGQETRPTLSGFDADRAPKFYRDADIDIAKRLALTYGYDGEFDVRAIDLVQRIVASGRAYWVKRGDQPLKWGAARPGRVEWRLAGAAGVRPYLMVEGAAAVNAEPPLYADEAEGVIGPVRTDLPDRTIYHLLSAPVIAKNLVSQVARSLGASLPPARAELLPAPPEPAVRIEEDPIPVLRLRLTKAPTYYYGQAEDLPLAHLSFRYGTAGIGLDEKAANPEIFHNGRIYTIVRRPGREKQALKRLTDAGFTEARRVHPYIGEAFRHDFKLPDAKAWLDFLNVRARDLRSQGFELHIDDNFPYGIAPSSGAFEADIDSSGIDWFELDIGINVEGRRLDVTSTLAELIRTPAFQPSVIQAMGAEESVYLPLPDGRHVAVTAERFLPLVLALHALSLNGTFVDVHGKIKLSRADVVPLAAFETEDFVFKGADNLRRMIGLLRAEGLQPQSPPAGFPATLRPYQAQGLAWLDLLRESGLGGILADDMGLGKTVQMLALLASEKSAGRQTGPSLIVAPTSLTTNWCNEAGRFAPDLSLLLLHGSARRQNFAEIARHDIVLTTYPLIARDHEVLLGHDWHMAVLDEAQTIKNPNATTTRWLRNLRARHRFCLTGTPMENHLGELWSLMSFVNPGFLGERTAFSRAWRTPIEKHGDTGRAAALARRVKPFLLRRTKGQVAADLPARSDIVERIELEGRQRDLYDSVRLSMAEKVRKAIKERGLARSHIIVLEALLKLRQVCCDPRLLKLDDGIERPSAKLDRLMQMIEELRSEGRRIIVFSQFTSMLALIQARCDEAGHDYSLLTGQTKDRRAAIEAFQGGARSLFLISLKAGGVGLNLTAADTVILYDPWWNPAVEAQAVDRAHRIGQDKAVFVYRMRTSGTIEEKMEDLKARKQALADGLFSPDGGIGAALTEADVAALLED